MGERKSSQTFQVIQLYCRCGHELEGEVENVTRTRVIGPPDQFLDRWAWLWCPGCGMSIQGDDVLIEWKAALADLMS